jgi:hypothetical protein
MAEPCLAQSLLCVPSQNGLEPVCLQPQNHMVRDFSALYMTGVKPVPECEPSQKGCFRLRPQAHQKYFRPASTLTLKGPVWATIESGILDFPFKRCGLTLPTALQVAK